VGTATDGLRNITGVVNGDGTATIYAITSTVIGNGDQGAEPKSTYRDHGHISSHQSAFRRKLRAFSKCRLRGSSAFFDAGNEAQAIDLLGFFITGAWHCNRCCNRESLSDQMTVLKPADGTRII
jgi:hypothetical protein